MHRVRRRLPAFAAVLVVVGVAGFAAASGSSPHRDRVSRVVPADRALLWAVGDGADDGGADARALAARIAADGPARVLYLGDVYDNGTAQEFRDNMAGVYGALLGRMWPTPGNHDWPAHRDGYDPFWAEVHGRPQPSYYERRIAGWQVLSLNSDAPHGPESAQVRWLRRHLRGSGTCRIAFWHRPRYSFGSHGDQPDTAGLWDTVAGRVALVLNGHDHNLQRLRPRSGTVEMVSGAGGAGHYPLQRGDPALAFGDDEHYGALRIELSRERARLAFVAVDGTVLDRSSVPCRR